ncbi:uncharacterized protein VP01_3561g1 [Puccinia sorghi]|uniref:Uncharacterized protein n=1 Tax=Puccinia sorghi TaxID=27349 RepID=A0A0L6UVF6_9BASI|nr:uncharacterized protein VP01_3561g1 [Puccinia sorghi]
MVLSYFDFCQPDLHQKGIQCLELNVLTRWNLMFDMFQRAILLQETCTHFCQQLADTKKYCLSPAEWTHAANVMKLLNPLSEATKILWGSSYPTLNTVLPVYLVKMIEKINHYLRLKTTFWINNDSFVEEHYNMLVNNIIKIFEKKCENCVSLQSFGREQPAFESAATEPKPSSYFASKLYQPPPNFCGVPTKNKSIPEGRH